ncbi:MAG: polysaccharide biosynthesis tyrosine autokinase [Planctomycetales bacterium]|nr:polysaccharide biosynthesis tyrosine autokinase [Planctomycetales bacterium]
MTSKSTPKKKRNVGSKPIAKAGRIQPAAANAARGAKNDHELSVQFFVTTFARWWKFVVPATLILVVALAAGVLYTFQPVFNAIASLRIQDSTPYVAFSDHRVDDRHDAKKYVHTQIELLRSRPILEQALSKPEIARIPEIAKRSDPVDWLATKALVILPKGDSELLEVSYAGPDPNDSAAVVNAVVDSYFSLHRDRSDQRINRVVELLEIEKTRREKQIAMLRSEIGELEKQLVTKDPNLIASTLGNAEVIVSDNPLRGIQESMAAAQVEAKVLEAQITALEEALQNEPEIPEVLLAKAVNELPEIATTLRQIGEKQSQLSQILTSSAQGENDPAYVRCEQDVKNLEVSLARLRENARPRIEAEMRAYAGLERQQNLAKLKTDLATKKLIVANMTANYQERLREASLSGDQTMDLRVKKDTLAREQFVYDLIAKRATELNTEKNAPNRVTPLHAATPPKIPVESIPWKLLALATMFGLITPMGLACLAEMSVRRVSNVEQLESQALIPVVGEIAKIPNRASSYTSGTQYELGIFEESIDSLRTGLILSHEHEDIQAIAVASAVSGEGKSSISSQLAVSLARSTGKPVLLIDGDMRSPDAHRIFNISNQVGLAEVLQGEKKLDEAINTEWSEHVHILPAGTLTKSPHNLLGSGEFKKVLDEARHWYRYIVIDTPPVLAASEALVMARDADASLVCCMRDVSRQSHTRTTYDRLLNVGARPIGAVLNGVPTRTYARRYGSYDYSG